MIIYKATNRINGKVYIGQTVFSLNRRKIEHTSNANLGDNSYFHNALLKYGIDNFRWQVICICPDIDLLNEQEEYYIAFYGSMKTGYNLTEGGGGRLGFKHTQESIKKMIDAKLGKPGKKHTEATKQKMSEAAMGEKNNNYGKRYTEERKRKISEALTGRECSEETRRKMSDAQRGEKSNMYGKHHPETTKKKMRIAWQKRKIRKRMFNNPTFQINLFKN